MWVYDATYNVAYCPECAEKVLGTPDTHRISVDDLGAKWHNERELECVHCQHTQPNPKCSHKRPA